MTVKCLREWLSLRRLAEIPSINVLKINDFPVEKGWVTVVYKASNGDLVFDHLGDNFLAEPEVKKAISTLDQVPKGTNLYYACRGVSLSISESAPVVTEGTVRKAKARILKLRAIALPFADSGGLPRYVFAAFSGRIFDETPDAAMAGLVFRAYRNDQWRDIRSEPDIAGPLESEAQPS